jgi:tetratricopeptide (TPR) repeat protein
MHARFLQGDYAADCSEFRRALDEGRYNCVTATLLFHCLCTEGDLQPRIMAASSHVFSQFADSDLGDVETTCAQWFRRPATGVGEESRAEGQAGPSRQITPVQLLGKLYYNAGVARLEAGDFPPAVRALETSLLLDEADRAARSNLLAALNNRALAEADAGRFEEAARLIEQGLQRAPDHDPLRANDLHIHQDWALALCQRGEYRPALELLERCYLRRPDADLFDLGRLAVFSLWAEALLEEGRCREACRVFEEARQRFPRRPEWSSYEENAICVSIDQLVRQGRQQEAVDLAAIGLARQPDSQRLQRLHRDLTRPES